MSSAPKQFTSGQAAPKHAKVTITAYQGDAKTLLAFDLPQEAAAGLAGFSIRVLPQGLAAYYLLNRLLLPEGPAHATVSGEPVDSTANAPIQKYRWLHVPGSFHQGETPFYGRYTYTVTARYFDANGALLPLDPTLGNSVDIFVGPYSDAQLQLGFTRGFVQSQAFVAHFGNKAIFRPADHSLLYDTGLTAGANSANQSYTFLEEYQWSGFTARQKIFSLLNQVVADKTLSIDVFAYDLDEPDIIKLFLSLAGEGRIRLILDNASLHHNVSKPEAEDQVEQLFRQSAKAPAAILRGRFGRYAHDKVIIVYKQASGATHSIPHASASGGPQPLSVLTGSTNFSVTGLYVNANHVLVFNNPDVAALYSRVFNESWNDNVSETFNSSSLAAAPFVIDQSGLPRLSITFSPHTDAVAGSILDGMTARIKTETSSVLFAVMDVASGGGSVLATLQQLHADQKIFSYGITDSGGANISLYKPGSAQGLLVTGKPGATILPPPFDKEENIGLDHQIHHKFIVCGFNTPSAVVWCGSSNLAAGGEALNGDNLLRIDDRQTATVFAIEAISLVDHFDFRDAHSSANIARRVAHATPAARPAAPGSNPATRPADAATPAAAHPATPQPLNADPNDTLTLYGDDSWVKKYYDPNDLYYKDRQLFAGPPTP